MASSTSTFDEDVFSEFMMIDETHSFSWVITDLTEELFPDLSYRKCAKFELGNTSEHTCTWEIELTKYSSFLQLYLKLIKQTLPFYASLSICLLSYDMNKKYESKDTLYFYAGNKFSFEKFLIVEELLQHKETLLHKGDLLIFGTITMFQDDINCDGRVFSEVESYYRQNMKSLLVLGTFSDFTIKVQEKKFQCHKMVLASRCQYFDCLFKNDMKENRSDLLVLEDIEPEEFEQVLMYIYSNELEITESTVVPLLEAAEKYQLEGLKNTCEEKMHQYFSFDNLLIIGVVADVFQLRSLMLRSLNMYAIFRKRLQASDEYGTLSKSRSKLSNNEENSAACNNTKTPSRGLENFNCTLCPVHQNTLIPPATIWIANNINIILDRKIRFPQVPSGNNYPIILLRNEKCKISFKLHHTFYLSSNTYYFSLYFTLLAFETETLHFHVLTSVVDTSGKEVLKGKDSFDFVVGYKQKVHDKSFYSSDIHKYLHGKDLIVRCKIWSEDCSAHLCPEIKRKNMDMDFTALLENVTFADMIIRVNGTEFSCHKAIVASQSPVLASLLEKNSNNDVIELLDIEPENMQKLLTIIYKEKYNLSETEALKLLPLACKFKLKHLKSMCERILAQNLCFENAVEMLNLSVCNSALELQKCSLQYVQTFLKKILANPEFSSKLQEYSLCDIILNDA